MYKQVPDKVAVTLSDAAAFFPEEEWKLLHEWQKELYRNVMNEIHQALISLGPLIATTVFSLRDNEKESVLPVVSQDSEGRHIDKYSSGVVTVSPDKSMEVKVETNQCLKNRKNSQKRQNCDYPCIVQPVLFSDTSVKVAKSKETRIWEPPEPEKRTAINSSTSGLMTRTSIIPWRISYFNSKISSIADEEATVSQQDIYSPVHQDIFVQLEEQKELHCRDWPGSDRSKNNNPPNKGIPRINTEIGLRKDEESDPFQIDHPGDERDKHTSPSSAGLEFTSFIIKEEEETCSLDHQGIKNRRSINVSTSQEESMNRQRKERACTERLPVKTVSSWQNDMNLPQTTEKETEPRNQLWSDNYWGLGVERNSDCEMGFGSPTHIDLQLWTPKEGTSCISSTHLSDLKKTSLFPNTKQIQRPYSCTECKRSFSLRAELIRHFRTHAGVRPYACTQCNKSFSKKGDFTRHWRTHTGEKPYECTDCHKRFNLKGNLDQHRVLIHSGVRPYNCNECEKSFSRQSHLIKHRKTHTTTFLSSMP